MSRVSEAILTFFVIYLSPLKPKAFAAKIDFWTGFSKTCPIKQPCHGRRALGLPRFTFSLTFLKTRP